MHIFIVAVDNSNPDVCIVFLKQRAWFLFNTGLHTRSKKLSAKTIAATAFQLAALSILITVCLQQRIKTNDVQ